MKCNPQIPRFSSKVIGFCQSYDSLLELNVGVKFVVEQIGPERYRWLLQKRRDNTTIEVHQRNLEKPHEEICFTVTLDTR